MERIVCKGGEELNKRLTDEMIAQANEFVSKGMAGKDEDQERRCRIWGDWLPNRFSIDCSTQFEFRDYRFVLEDDGTVKYESMEGDFRD